MQRITDDNRALSVRLSRVLGDVGINKDMILRRRKTWILNETLATIGFRAGGLDTNVFIFGSQTEGTTSPRLGSDIDMLVCMNNFPVIQDLSERQLGKINLLILRDQTAGPGYCRLQVLREDPLPNLILPADVGPFFTVDDSKRILFKNTMVFEVSRSDIPDFVSMEGPAICRAASEPFMPQDTIIAYYCKSWTYEARSWLVRKRGHWPPQNLIRAAEKSGCLIVAKGQKLSPFQNLEWRISTSVAERMLMFSMNITYLQCYYSLKVIIKTFITNCIGKCVSSYHCKTVVFYSIESSSPQLWREERLFDCIRYCLQQLHSYLSAGHLPNFFIPEDNLITERISQSKMSQVIEILDNILSDCGQFLFSIEIEDIRQRLLNSCNKLPAVEVISPHTLCSRICDLLAMSLYGRITNTINKILHKNALTVDQLRITINTLISLARHGTTFQQSAAIFLLPTLCSSLGSMIAASDISRGRDLSPTVTVLFKYGEQSDMTSSRLKFASILYCRGDFKSAEELLNDLERMHDRSEIQPVCTCYTHPVFVPLRKSFSACAYNAATMSFSQNVSYCVRFLPSEIPCVPQELQYEMFRSSGDDAHNRDLDWWMDWSVIDSLPFLHYLQYLVYRQLGSSELQQRSLSNLTTIVTQEPNLGHRETALNLRGKCLEKENRFNEAYVSYEWSLRFRPRNNAAKYHIRHMPSLICRLYKTSPFCRMGFFIFWVVVCIFVFVYLMTVYL